MTPSRTAWTMICWSVTDRDGLVYRRRCSWTTWFWQLEQWSAGVSLTGMGLCTAGDAAERHGFDTLMSSRTRSGKTLLPMVLTILLDDPADHQIMITISPLKHHLQVTQKSDFNQRYGNTYSCNQRARIHGSRDDEVHNHRPIDRCVHRCLLKTAVAWGFIGR